MGGGGAGNRQTGYRYMPAPHPPPLHLYKLSLVSPGPLTHPPTAEILVWWENPTAVSEQKSLRVAPVAKRCDDGDDDQGAGEHLPVQLGGMGGPLPHAHLLPHGPLPVLGHPVEVY
jgi:hypothetical protein